MANEDSAQQDAERLAEYMDRLEEWPSGVLADRPLGAYVPLRDEWTGRPLDWKPDVLAKPNE